MQANKKQERQEEDTQKNFCTSKLNKKTQTNTNKNKNNNNKTPQTYTLPL